MKRLFYIVFCCSSFMGLAQNNTLVYTREYEFKEGVFLTITQFKNNDPIPPSAIKSTIPNDQIDFLERVIKQKEFVYTDPVSGHDYTIQTGSTWGYCQNRVVRINYKNQFARLNVIGTVCQFAAIVLVKVNYPSSMGMGMGMGMGGIGMGGMGYNSTTTVEETHEFIYDTRSHDILEFNPKTIEMLFQDDDELYKEYMDLKRRKRSDLQFYYLRKYNDRHPLYMPDKGGF